MLLWPPWLAMADGRPLYFATVCFIYLFLIYFLIFQSWISETVGDSSAEVSRQVVWGAGIERVYLTVPKFRWGELGSKKGQQFHDLSRFATAEGRLLTWADRSPLPHRHL